MFNNLKQLMNMKQQAEKIKQELEAEIVEVSAVKGIKVLISGTQNFKSIEIEPSQINADSKKGLERDLLISVNAAIDRSQDLAAQKMSSMTGLPMGGI